MDLLTCVVVALYVCVCFGIPLLLLPLRFLLFPFLLRRSPSRMQNPLPLLPLLLLLQLLSLSLSL